MVFLNLQQACCVESENGLIEDADVDWAKIWKANSVDGILGTPIADSSHEFVCRWGNTGVRKSVNHHSPWRRLSFSLVNHSFADPDSPRFKNWLVVWNIFFISWECHNPNWRTPSFFRGVGKNHQPDPQCWQWWFGMNGISYTQMRSRRKCQLQLCQCLWTARKLRNNKK